MLPFLSTFLAAIFVMDHMKTAGSSSVKRPACLAMRNYVNAKGPIAQMSQIRLNNRHSFLRGSELIKSIETKYADDTRDKIAFRHRKNFDKTDKLEIGNEHPTEDSLELEMMIQETLRIGGFGMISPGDFHRIGNEVTEIIDKHWKQDQALDLSRGKLTNFPLAPVLMALLEHDHSSQIAHLWLNDNDLFGRMYWKLLPQNVEALRIDGNRIDGKIEWDILPKTLKSIMVSKYIGRGSVRDLPNNWELLRVSKGVILFFKKVRV